MRRSLGFPAIALIMLSSGCAPPPSADRTFEELGGRYLEELSALAPIEATGLGDHRFDGDIDDLSAVGRERAESLYSRYLEGLSAIDRRALSRANQVDARLLEHDLRYRLWRLKELQEWIWNPLVYTQLAGDAVYYLVARDFAPLQTRLENVTDRLEKLPGFLEQARANLDPVRVPPVHARTAAQQNPGIMSVVDALVSPELHELEAEHKQRLERAIAAARVAVDTHQKWLEDELLPNAAGDFRLGSELYNAKLAFALHSTLSRAEIRKRATEELARVREEMWEIAKQILQEHRGEEATRTAGDDAGGAAEGGSGGAAEGGPLGPIPDDQQAEIQAALEIAYHDRPERDAVVEAARRSLSETTRFVREHDLITVPDDPLEIIIMPEFQRGIALAYCDAPGPLDAGQKTFYSVSPIPAVWSEEQVESFLREYNTRSIHDLTIHEAMPGHYVQLAHSNRYPSTLRAVLASGPFIEGWAVYAERLMVDEGWLDGDPLMRLINLKWYLRAIANAILDQAIHVDGMNRDEAMEFMTVQTFQEEREAAAKWVRAQLTSAQLPTYFVGYQEHADLRDEAETVLGESFDLKRHHDTVLSFGSPPVQYVRALMFDLDID